MGARGAAGEHEASRRMKTELLIQMDGLARSNRVSSSGSEPEPQVFVLCATNLPWELDTVGTRLLWSCRIVTGIGCIQCGPAQCLLWGRLMWLVLWHSHYSMSLSQQHTCIP